MTLSPFSFTLLIDNHDCDDDDDHEGDDDDHEDDGHEDDDVDDHRTSEGGVTASGTAHRGQHLLQGPTVKPAALVLKRIS